MDIRNWPLGQIMQLPDYCFGQRYGIFTRKLLVGTTPAWDISEIGLPETFVLWSVVIETYNDAVTPGVFRIALGDQLPTTTAMMNALEPLLMGYGRQGPEPRDISLLTGRLYTRLPMRKLVASSGRRLVLEITGVATKTCIVRVALEVSSIPTEVPDWLVSR